MHPDHIRLAALIGDPGRLRLPRLLSRLGSILTFANSGAHPDDEHNGLLAALRFGRGIRVVILCSTRGEGGQNVLGPERMGALGALRTRELEVAAERIDAGIHWLGHGVADPVHDFGFSKNAEDTLARWGEARLLDRMVRAYRVERPDIVTATFLDVPGQHGHHRAMTRTALRAIALAADPAYRTDELPPWQVAKFYVPAWTGASSSYDDEVPPPPATLTIAPAGGDPATGATWSQIGEWSRAGHASQGMGKWRPTAPDRWQLHLLWHAEGLAAIEADIAEGLPASLGALAGVPPACADALHAADLALARTRAAYPDLAALRREAEAASAALAAARRMLPADVALAHDHRLVRKLVELGALFAGVPALPAPARKTATAVTITPEALILDPDQPAPSSIVIAAQGSVTLDLPPDWQATVGGDGSFSLLPPAPLPPGITDIHPSAGGAKATHETLIAYPHIGTILFSEPAVLRVLSAAIARPAGARIGYIGGGNDRVGIWLARLGLDVTPLDPAGTTDLARFSTIVIGIMAFGTCPGLAAAAGRLHGFVAQGGHLLTLYHRPTDGWDPATIPPRRLAIGGPSLRWRVTDPAAPVTILAEGHTLLTTPNRIGTEDWSGWEKERGLYFAADWDAAYTPLIALSDPGEARLTGALLSAEIGRGRHTHCALALHHQLDRLVPGAFRLLANLVQPAATGPGDESCRPAHGSPRD